MLKATELTTSRTVRGLPEFKEVSSLNVHALEDSSNRSRISVFNPATGDLVSDQIPLAGEADVDAAVGAACRAFAHDSPWRKFNGFERQAILLKFADLLETNRDRLAYLTRLTLGAPFLPFGKSEIDTAIGCFRCKWIIICIAPFWQSAGSRYFGF